MIGMAYAMSSVMLTSCKKEDNKSMGPTTPPPTTSSVSLTEAALVGDWICEGDSIYTSGVPVFDSTYVDWHLELVSTVYADTTVGPGYMQSGWYSSLATPSTPYYWRVADTGDPHYQLNSYVLSSYPYQYIMTVTATKLVLATNEGMVNVKRRIFYK